VRLGERVDPQWTWTEVIHGYRCLFTFRHGVSLERAEGNVLEVKAALYKRFGNEFRPTELQVASWLAGRTDGVESVEVRAEIGAGATATVVEINERQRAAKLSKETT
jgi:hypothetical protein